MDGSGDLVALCLKQLGATASDVAHDRGHVLRVLSNAREIAAGEGVEVGAVLTAAAILHDIVALPKTHPERARASVLSSRKAWSLVRDMGFSREESDAVAHAVAAHSFSGEIEPQTAEARILRDADRLDALGAVGIARCFAVSGGLGRTLWHPDDPFAEARDLDDGRYALDHFATKLLRLGDDMATATGRRLAEARTEVLRRYLDDLAREIRV